LTASRGPTKTDRPPTERCSVLLPFFFFLLVLVVHSLSPVWQSHDSAWTVHIALSIMKEGNADLDEYRQDVERGGRYLYEVINGHIYSTYPLGTPLLVAPIVFAIDRGLQLIVRLSPRAEELIRTLRRLPAGRVDAASLHLPVEAFVASLVVAATALLVFFVGRQFPGCFTSAVLGCIFAFCTPAWSTASRGLWQHGPSMLMLTAALLIALKAGERQHLIQYLSIPLAYAFVIRPTNAIAFVAFTAFVIVRHRRYLLRYAAWSLVVAVPFVWYNLWLYGTVVPPYFSPQKVGATGHLLEGLAGNLVSPSRGLLVYAPVLAFSVWGAVLKLREGRDRVLDLTLVSIVVVHWLVISSFPDWYGGHCYGPRYFTDVIPYPVYFLVPVIAQLARLRGVLKAGLVSLFTLCVLASLFANGIGAVSRTTEFWNSSPVDIDEAPQRAWDWSDPQFLRGIRQRP